MVLLYHDLKDLQKNVHKVQKKWRVFYV